MTVTEPQHNKVLIHASGPFADTKLLLFSAEETQRGAERSGPDEGDVLDGAAGLGEAGSRQLLCARHIVRPAAETQPVQCPRFNKQKNVG